MTAPARRAAHRVLRDVDTGRVDLSTALARARRGLEDPRDRALVGKITTGTLRWRAALDHLIEQVSFRPVDRLDPAVSNLLRAGAYQLLFLERIPNRAAVHDAVALARQIGKASAAGFVNAVLRGLAERRGAPALPTRPEVPTGGEPDRRAALDYLSITLSHPRWLVERWLDRHGYDAAMAWAHFNNKPAPITLCANTLKCSRSQLADRLATHGIDTDPGRWGAHTLVIKEGNPLTTPLAAEGWFLIQDEASQLITKLVGAPLGARVLDTCASPGTKTVGIAGAMKNQGLIVATDVRPRRLRLLTETLARCTTHCVRVARADLARPLPFRAVFDRVLVDAPCSGLGTLRRDPDIRWRREPVELPALADRQAAMLANASTVVRPGGQLTYATCSSEPEENEQVVAHFLATHDAFEAITPNCTALRPLIDEVGHFRTLPFRDRLEAFYAAVLRRRIR